MDVSVLIPVLNEARILPETVERMQAQDFDGELEFLFIDGRSDDSTRDLVRAAAASDSRVRLLDNPERGIPFALNIGLTAARGQYVARMDAHSFYPPDYLAIGVERLRRGDADWISGPQLATGIDDGTDATALALGTRLGIGGAAFRTAAEEFESDAGFTGVWRRRTLIDRGGWNESWTVNEDGELAARILEDGGRILCVPAMAARYVPRGSLRALARQYWRYGQFRTKTCVAHPESMRRSHVLPPAVASMLTLASLPGRIGRTARLGTVVYALALTTSLSTARSGGVRLAVRVPPVLATMHLSWGFGFLMGCFRFGVPVRAIVGLARR